jgi:hypothetical protein
MEKVQLPEADLRGIEFKLQNIQTQINFVNLNLNKVDNNIDNLHAQINALSEQIATFERKQMLENRLGQAETKIVKIRQEIENKFGHYAKIRRLTTGILQGTDLGIIKKETISNVTEKTMISTPGYWLAPCLVALSAWISDDKDLADKAVKEAIKRNDEKTSLFFGLICRRANRKAASLKWFQRYLENQDSRHLDRKAVIVIDAFVSGLLGADSESLISQQISKWIEEIMNEGNSMEQQMEQWKNTIALKKPYEVNLDYPYLEKYSTTWSLLKEIMKGAKLHNNLYNYFKNIFDKKHIKEPLKKELDRILDDLVTNFDAEEIPLRKQEKFEQFVINYKGDENQAQTSMRIEETAFKDDKDFMQLLTDASMKPESSKASVSTQKFAIAISKEWIEAAYTDLIAENRAKIPHEIEILIGTFRGKTQNGENENELISEFSNHNEKEKEQELEKYKLTSYDNFFLYGGALIGILGLFMLSTGVMGIFGIIAGIGMILHYNSIKKSKEANYQRTKDLFAERLEKGIIIIRAIMAETVDFREEFSKTDAESEKVLDFLRDIHPEQYINKLDSNSRRININA